MINIFKLISFIYLCDVVFTFEVNASGALIWCDKNSKEDENLPFPKITECKRKIRLKVNLINTKKTPENVEYLYLREVKDPVTKGKMKLLNPLVIQLRQDQVLLSYPFKFLSAVNGKASEIVVNYQNTKNYTGCDVSSAIRPTCGIHQDRGVPLKYSQGFCCFCPETPVNSKQSRGGQDCSLPAGPTDYVKQRYKASAHCLTFNDVWYTVNAISEPLIIHNVDLQVFNQRYASNGSAVWVSLTHNEKFELGYKNATRTDPNNTIVANLLTNAPKSGSLVISSADNRLLIPQPMPGVEEKKLPLPVQNGASDYMLISKSVVDASGITCDMAGVSYEAFTLQKTRCNVPKDTCLKNQPLDFWESDNEKRKSGQKGKYLLENYGTPYKEAILTDPDTKEHWLALEYYSKQHTVITIELNADKIVALPAGKHAQITSVVSASYPKLINYYVEVTNLDLIAVHYSAMVGHCQYDVWDSNNVSVEVPPQKSRQFELTSKLGAIELNDIFTCNVTIYSAAYDAVATREVKIQPLQRCVCNRHCKCVCLDKSKTCIPLSVEDYHAAGFRGDVPSLIAKRHARPWIVGHYMVFLFALLFAVLLIGFAKAVIGRLFSPTVRDFGLQDRIYKTDPSSILEQKTPVRSLTENQLFLLNVFFVFVWPFFRLLEWWSNRKSGDPSSNVLLGTLKNLKDKLPISKGKKDKEKQLLKKQDDRKEKVQAHVPEESSSSFIFGQQTERQKQLQRDLKIKTPQDMYDYRKPAEQKTKSRGSLRQRKSSDLEESQSNVSLDFEFSSSEEDESSSDDDPDNPKGQKEFKKQAEKLRNIIK